MIEERYVEAYFQEALDGKGRGGEFLDRLEKNLQSDDEIIEYLALACRYTKKVVTWSVFRRLHGRVGDPFQKLRKYNGESFFYYDHPLTTEYRRTLAQKAIELLQKIGVPDFLHDLDYAIVIFNIKVEKEVPYQAETKWWLGIKRKVTKLRKVPKTKEELIAELSKFA